ncbi:MAG: metal-sensing transcriptional repressor [Clostridia bacterium]|nr:metal-sensing transcriptional repressor [Clostridia bacterium]
MDAQPCTQKVKKRSPEQEKRLLDRLSRIEGQVRGLKNMIENGVYCTDVVNQAAAAAAALNAFSREVLGEHIRTCVADDIRGGHDEVIDDLLKTLQKLLK